MVCSAMLDRRVIGIRSVQRGGEFILIAMPLTSRIIPIQALPALPRPNMNSPCHGERGHSAPRLRNTFTTESRRTTTKVELCHELLSVISCMIVRAETLTCVAMNTDARNAPSCAPPSGGSPRPLTRFARAERYQACRSYRMLPQAGSRVR